METLDVVVKVRQNYLLTELMSGASGVSLQDVLGDFRLFRIAVDAVIIRDNEGVVTVKLSLGRFLGFGGTAGFLWCRCCHGVSLTAGSLWYKMLLAFRFQGIWD